MSASLSHLARLGQELQCFAKDRRGQDMIEYALLAAAVAVIVAGFLPPTVMPSVSTIFSKVVAGFNAS